MLAFVQRVSQKSYIIKRFEVIIDANKVPPNELWKRQNDTRNLIIVIHARFTVLPYFIR